MGFCGRRMMLQAFFTWKMSSVKKFTSKKQGKVHKFSRAGNLKKSYSTPDFDALLGDFALLQSG